MDPHTCGLLTGEGQTEVAVLRWLGLDTSGGSLCPFCSAKALDPLGHHAITCSHGGDVVNRHNLPTTWESQWRLVMVFGSFTTCLWDSAATAATPAVKQDSPRMAGVSGDVSVISKVAGKPFLPGHLQDVSGYHQVLCTIL